VILGGVPIGDEDVGYGPARGMSAIEVKEVASAVCAISEAAFRARFDADALNEADIYPQIWDEGSDALDYVASYFLDAQRVYKDAAAMDLALVLFIN
jgi:hypothetical protein